MSRATLFLVISHDLRVHAVERPFNTPARTTDEVLRLLKCDARPPVLHRLGPLTLAWRDSRDVSFDPVNPAAWLVARRLARGLLVVLGPEHELRSFRVPDAVEPLPARLNA